MLCNI